MTRTEAYYGAGLLALLWATYYFQMSDDKKRFSVTSVWSDEESEAEPMCDEKDPEFEDPPFVKQLGGSANEECFYQAQIAYHKEHSNSYEKYDLKGSIHANLIEICGLAIGIVRDPYNQTEAKDDIVSKVRQTDGFMTTYLDESDEDALSGGNRELLDSYHDIWERLERIGVLAKLESY